MDLIFENTENKNKGNILQSKLLNKLVRTVPLCAAGITLSPPLTNVICLILPSNIVDLVPIHKVDYYWFGVFLNSEKKKRL